MLGSVLAEGVSNRIRINLVAPCCAFLFRRVLLIYDSNEAIGSSKYIHKKKISQKKQQTTCPVSRQTIPPHEENMETSLKNYASLPEWTGQRRSLFVCHKSVRLKSMNSGSEPHPQGTRIPSLILSSRLPHLCVRGSGLGHGHPATSSMDAQLLPLQKV